MSLPLADARSIVAQMKTKYQLFERLEDALVQAERAEQLISELNAKRAELEKLISTRIAEIAQLDESKANVIQQTKEAKADMEKLRQASIVEVGLQKTALANARNEANIEKADLEAKTKAAQALHELHLNDFAQNEATIKARIAELQNSFERLKTKITSL